MTTTALDADYLIVGSGAIGMAFADILLSESDATIAMVDRYAKPGGIGTLPIRLCNCTSPRSSTG